MNYSKVLWDINTKFLPVIDHRRSQLSTKFEGASCTENGFPVKTILNFSRAWQAYFLSDNLQIWGEVKTFKGVYVIWFWLWYLCWYRISKNLKSFTLQVTELYGLTYSTYEESSSGCLRRVRHQDSYCVNKSLHFKQLCHNHSLKLQDNLYMKTTVNSISEFPMFKKNNFNSEFLYSNSNQNIVN